MKKTLIKTLSVTSFLIILVLIMGVLLQTYLNTQLTPVSTEEIKNVLISYGLQPTDVTESAHDNFPGAGLKECIVAENDDIRFEFYNFDNTGNALKVYKEAHTLIVTTKMELPRIEMKYHKANYRYYSLTAGGHYSVTTYVKNTAIYAYCDEKDIPTITGILDSIKYVETKSNSETPGWVLSVVRILQYALYILFASVTRSFYWKAAYKSAGVTNSQFDNAEKTRYELSEWFIEISPRRKTTKILLKIYRYFLIPEYICVILATVGCFTSLFDQLLNHVLGIALICLILCAGIFGGIVARLFK